MSIRAAAPRLAALMGALMLLGACAGGTPQAMRDAAAEPATLDVYRSTKAVRRPMPSAPAANASGACPSPAR